MYVCMYEPKPNKDIPLNPQNHNACIYIYICVCVCVCVYVCICICIYNKNAFWNKTQTPQRTNTSNIDMHICASDRCTERLNLP